MEWLEAMHENVLQVVGAFWGMRCRLLVPSGECVAGCRCLLGSLLVSDLVMSCDSYMIVPNDIASINQP